MVKYCTKCKLDKDISEFAKNSSKKDGLQAQCRLCKKTTDSVRYARRSTYHKSVVKRNKESLANKRRSRLKAILQKSCCMDCKNSDWRVLEFDHVTPSNKLGSISEMLCSGLAWGKIISEIEKCEIVCANCHRLRTMIRGGHWRAKYGNVAQLVEQ